MVLDRPRLAVSLLVVLLLLASVTVARAADDRLLVFAASSLTESLTEIVDSFEAQFDTEVVVSFAASSVLARQIEHGAPADVFVSANRHWMEYLEAKQCVDPQSRTNIASNQLVLAVREQTNLPGAARLEPGDVSRVLDGDQLAMSLVDAVPSGVYGKAALQSLGEWISVQPHVVQTDNVRAALMLLARGETRAAIVYRSDVAADARVAVAGYFDPADHEAIVYPAAVTTRNHNPKAIAFVQFLRTPAAQAVFERRGFRPVTR